VTAPLRFDRVHHVAIATADPLRLAAFYERLGLKTAKEHRFDDGLVRSVWLELGGGAILMLELADTVAPSGAAPFATKTPGLHLLALAIAAADRARVVQHLLAADIRIEHETPFTLYIRDPEGNRIGLSHYPDPA
jgi:glyoxylase I family protein